MTNYKIEFVPFDERYLEDFEYNGIEIGLFKHTNVNDLIRHYAREGKALMGLRNGKMGGASGIYPVAPWLGFSWAFINKVAKENPFDVYEAIRDGETQFVKELGVHRLQTHAMEKERIAWKMLELLGYKREGIMKAFGRNKEDYIMYSKLFV